MVPRQEKEETKLLRKFFAGDNGAFQHLFNRYHKQLTLYAAKMLGNREQADDIAQDVWMRVIDQRKRPPTIEHASAFLFTIARNLCIDSLRANRHHSSVDEIDEHKHPQAPENEQTELEEIVLLALDSLTPDDRELLVLHTYLGYGYDEIAVMQSKNPQAVWTRASRARAKLREIVQREARRAGVEIPGRTKEQSMER